MKNYSEELNKKLEECYGIANKARKKKRDAEEKVEIVVANNMAERVEGLVSVMAPHIVNKGIPKRIQELEKTYPLLDWRISLTIALEIAQEKFCKFETKKEAIETGIRVGFAYHTLGTVSSPLDGFSNIEIRKRADGKDYMALFYSGPIRSAGGTGASVSILIADFVRKKMGFEAYDPTEVEIKRMITELYDYHERINNLQYLPSEDEIKFLMKNLPVQIDGDPSEKIEVSNYKDLKRVQSNKIRNGPCLVIGECLAQKAPKLWRQISKWGNDFELSHWAFLEEFVRMQKKIKSKEQTSTNSKIAPDFTYINDLVAGRPVLSHPTAFGGFRLRYGRGRTSGFSSNSIHPATMVVLNNYIAIGTQLKTERPGKSTALTTCDSIDGPIVLLNNGSVVKADSEKESKELFGEIKEILFLGDILINYGDFYNRAHPLVPSGYCEEWWVKELEKSIVSIFGNLDLDKVAELVGMPKGIINIILKEPIKTKISFQSSIIISEKLGIPLHPDYTYYWNAISPDQLKILMDYSKKKIRLIEEDKKINKAILPYNQDVKRIMELIGVPHILANNEFIVIEKDHAGAFCASLGLPNDTNLDKISESIGQSKDKKTVEIINTFSKAKIRDKGGTFIGARMGRPEKAKMRQLTGKPHVLFPVGDEGGRMRCFQSALEIGKIRAEFPIFFCRECNAETEFSRCTVCDKKTVQKYYCKICGVIEDNECKKHGTAETFRKKEIDIKKYFEASLKKLKATTYPDLIKGVRGTSNKGHIPEHLIKGILRAKHNICVNKDGTTRYDMTQLGITYFKPKEINASVEKLVSLGYETDMHGKPLESPEQLLEIKPQDVILPSHSSSSEEGADKVLFKISKFIDDLLENFYGIEPYYNLESENELIGHLIIGLAPHTSAAILGRIIGFSKTQGYFAHPLFHAAQRRDLDGDESCVMLLMDPLLNFSRKYLPAHKGSVQDAPLVLTSNLNPSEVDDMVFDMDCAFSYPLEFYEATLQYKMPWEVKITRLGERLLKGEGYEKIGFTHQTSNFNNGVKCSSYKTMTSMEEKLKGQIELAEKIRAVDESDVARLVIEKHFLKDIRGNLRKFSNQEFRCVSCNEKFRRPPLIGRCTKCKGRIIFTVSKGTIIKYLEPSLSIADKYNLPAYLKQTLELTKRRIEGVFGKEKEKQEGLGRWFG